MVYDLELVSCMKEKILKIIMKPMDLDPPLKTVIISLLNHVFCCCSSHDLTWLLVIIKAPGFKRQDREISNEIC